MRYSDTTIETRVKLIRRVDEEKNAAYVNFLKEKNLYRQFALETKLTIGQTIKSISNENIERYGKIEVFNGKNYLIYKEPMRYTEIYEILPSIYNDELFTWKKNKKYQTMEATLVNNSFEFYVIYRSNGTAVINCKYTKCENKHRNKVTIATIELENASNKKILEAIEFWKTAFSFEVRTMM